VHNSTFNKSLGSLSITTVTSRC